MHLASYMGVRDGVMALGTYALRLRLHLSTKPCATHTELVFEPADGPEVAALMPDGSLLPDSNGALWCASSVGLERMPAYSRRRAGRLGGVRFKRISLVPEKWSLLPLTSNGALTAAKWFRDHEGSLYDWQLIGSFLVWALPNKSDRTHCSEACAAALGFPSPHRLDPVTLQTFVSHIPAMARRPFR